MAHLFSEYERGSNWTWGWPVLKKKTHGYEREDNHPKPWLTQWKAAIIDPDSRVGVCRHSSLTLTCINPVMWLCLDQQELTGFPRNKPREASSLWQRYLGRVCFRKVTEAKSGKGNMTAPSKSTFLKVQERWTPTSLCLPPFSVLLPHALLSLPSPHECPQ